MSKVLITGGCGFLGLHLANYLSWRGMEVRLLDCADLTPADYKLQPEFVKADVRDFNCVWEATQGVRYVVHAAAALPSYPAYEIFSTNILGMVNVLKAAQMQEVERVVFVSSTSVYGIPARHPVYEEDPLIGVGPYGESKIIAEKICEVFRQTGMVVPIVRPKTFVGPYRLGVFEILFEWVKQNRRIPLIGSGHNRYQLLAVSDLVEAIYLLLTEDSNLVNDTFNVAAENFGTVRQDLSVLFNFTGNKPRFLPVPSKVAKTALMALEKMRLSPLYKWVYETVDKDHHVSIDKIKERLGWQPKLSNAEALLQSYKWFLGNYKEIVACHGIGHRKAWDQGALKILNKILRF